MDPANSVNDLERRVIEIVAAKKKIDPASITSATTFEELSIDSLDATDLMFMLEEEFDILVPDEAARSMRAVGQVVDGIRELVAAKRGGAGAA